MMESETILVEKCADIIHENELNEKLGEMNETLLSSFWT